MLKMLDFQMIIGALLPWVCGYDTTGVPLGNRLV